MLMPPSVASVTGAVTAMLSNHKTDCDESNLTSLVCSSAYVSIQNEPMSIGMNLIILKLIFFIVLPAHY